MCSENLRVTFHLFPNYECSRSPPYREPNQRFLVIESLKSPSRLTSICFAGPIIRFLHITGPRKELEGCRLEKEGPFPAGHP